MGCVFEDRIPGATPGLVLRPPPPWKDTAGKPLAPSVCPLYLGRVAEASDVWPALAHFRRGNLAAWLGRDPDPPLLDCLESVENGQAWWDSDPNGGARKAGA